MNRNAAFTLSAFLLLSMTATPLFAADQQPMIELVDTDGIEDSVPLSVLEIGDSLSLALDGFAPDSEVNIHLHDDKGREWSYSRVFTNEQGRVPAFLFWFQSGVIGTTLRPMEIVPDPAFETFDEAEEFFGDHAMTLTALDKKGKLLALRDLPMRPRVSPLLYPSNEFGVLENAVDAQREKLWATGRNFPAGSTVHLFVVPNQSGWQVGDALEDPSGDKLEHAVETIQLGSTQTSFTVDVWTEDLRPGAYDLVARIGSAVGPAQLQANDVLSFNDDTGVVLYIIVNGNIVIESAGRMKSGPAKFEFSDAFEKGEDVWAAVDPTDVPAVHAGGSYAAYYVIDDEDPPFYDGPAPPLVDVTGNVEIHRVKYWCINATRRLVWPNATQPEPIKGYDVVVDFGAVPAMDSASFVFDNTYDKGLDFVDGYDTEGFWVYEDPSSPGPFAIGDADVDDPNGVAGLSVNYGPGNPSNYDVTMAWATIRYPATVAGTAMPVDPTEPSYPIALFLHGRHWSCDNDGAGPGLAGGYDSPFNPPCALANRIPSHEGYDYILDRLASQGIFAISINAHQLQWDNGAQNYDIRGRLILWWLDELRDWNDNGTDPFGGLFQGRLDLSRIALSGHSRGGEGVVAAQELNLVHPNPHSIVAVNAIAPTDQNGTSYLMTEAPYYLLVGARDGDVWNMQGFRTYDRAFPQGAVNREPKTVAWVYGANHNYFNTVWTDGAALGSPNPWAGSLDDAQNVAVSQTLSAADQRQVALTTVAAFFRRHLQGIDPYKEIFTGRVRPAAMPNPFVFWTYQDDERLALDDFEQLPQNAAQNSLGGMVTAPGFGTFAERLLNHDSTDYGGGFMTDGQFYHDTLGLKLAWAAPQTYTTELPVGQGDVSQYSHLTLRAAKKVTGVPGPGPAVNLFVNVEDGDGDQTMWDLRTDQFDPIPHPYERSFPANQALLTGVRIPLRNFTQNNSGVDLDDLVRVTVRTEGAGEIGIDDIEFGN